MTLTWNGAQSISRVEKAVSRGLLIAGEIVRDAAVSSIMSGAKSGEVYTTKFFSLGSGPGRLVIPYGIRPAHTASAKGEAPASDTGRLASSGEVLVDKMSVTVHFASEYAWYLEKGTDRNAPRPFLIPAFNRSIDAINNAINAELRAEFQ